MTKTGEKSTYLLWAVWIAVGVLMVAIGVLAFLEVRNARQVPVEEPSAEPVLQTEQTTESEPTEPPTTDCGMPILELRENPYGPEDFAYKGRYLTCTAGECLLGIDVSYWQGDVNWTLVKAVGMDFAMIRLAWRGTEEGKIEADSYALANYEGAKEAGMQVGGYFFSQAMSVEEAVEEAEFALEMIRGWEMDLPIVFDWEYAGGSRTLGMTPQLLTDCAKAFCQTIEAAGYEAMVYFNPVAAAGQIYLEELKEYGFWLAMWDAEMEFPYRVDMWQYSATGSVPGIYGDVDLDIYFKYDD